MATSIVHTDKENIARAAARSKSEPEEYSRYHDWFMNTALIYEVNKKMPSAH